MISFLYTQFWGLGHHVLTSTVNSRALVDSFVTQTSVILNFPPLSSNFTYEFRLIESNGTRTTRKWILHLLYYIYDEPAIVRTVGLWEWNERRVGTFNWTFDTSERVGEPEKIVSQYFENIIEKIRRCESYHYLPAIANRLQLEMKSSFEPHFYDWWRRSASSLFCLCACVYELYNLYQQQTFLCGYILDISQ